MNSFRSIIGLWPSLDAMAGDLGAPITAVRKWWQRDRIPAEWWQAVAESSVGQAAGVTPYLMARLLARERPASLEVRT
jgi:hypothetical protein